jgi:hypothetical protein
MTRMRWLCLWAGFVVAFAGGVTAQTASNAPAQSPAKADASDGVVAKPWPRTFDQDGVQLTLHQPQIDDWQGNTLTGRFAVAVKTGTETGADGKPHDKLSYGVAWFKARTDVDKVGRKVTLSNVDIDKVSFPTDRANETKYTDLLRRIADQRRARVVSLDQLESAIAINREIRATQSVEGVRNDPPDILFSFQPALLVLIDGEPKLKPAGAGDVERVVNTRTLILKQNANFYLTFASRWFTASALVGPWTATL